VEVVPEKLNEAFFHEVLLEEVCMGAHVNSGSTFVFQGKKKQRLLWRRGMRVLKVTSGNNAL
jgi:hypothetical protein